MKLNFALCTDENFVVPALVCITSIFEANISQECHITILTEGLSDKSVYKFRQLSKIYKRTINIVRIEKDRFKNLISYGRYPTSMYFRFLLPEILKDEDKVLYLDCDILVRRSLSDLFCLDIDGYSCGVVLDQQCDDVQITNRLRIDSQYFNSGVMLMNLKEWRTHCYTDKIIDYLALYPEKCVYPDQDALNVILSGTVKYLDLSYNLQEMWLTMRDYARFNYKRYPELDKAKINPHIIHFCVGDKPWYYECKNPYMDEYLKIAGLHTFIGFRQRHHYQWPYFRLDAEKMRLERWQKKFVNK